MAVRNVARGGGKAYKEAVQGLKDLEKKLKALSADNPALKADLYKVVGAAANELRDEMRTQARAAGWDSQVVPRSKVRLTHAEQRGRVPTGEDAIQSIFSYSAPRGESAGRPKKISALAGVGKARTMVEWKAAKWGPKSPPTRTPRKVAPGNLVAMAFATMLEFGTTTRTARPAIRTAVKTAKELIIDDVSGGYTDLLTKYSK